MYCSSCGKELSSPPRRCQTCGRFTLAFWLWFYSVATLGIVLAAALVYFSKLVPIALVGHINLATIIRPFILWQFSVSTFINDWWLALIIIAFPIVAVLIRQKWFSASLRSGHVLGIACLAATTLFAITVLYGYWDAASILVTIAEKLHR